MPNSPASSELNNGQFIADLLSIAPDGLIEGIQERLAISPLGLESPAPHRFRVDKWLLSSATQKLIRRGRAEDAVKTALALHDLDPAYLPRRLPIIAFEDVSIGGLDICFDVLHVFASQRFSVKATDADQRRLLTNLVGRLAQSVKSRTACDIVCLARGGSDFLSAAAAMARLGVNRLIQIAANKDEEDPSRGMALLILSGLSMQERGQYRTVSRFNGDALKAVAAKLNLPSVIAWMLVKGRNTAGLAAMLPLALEAATGEDLRIERLLHGESTVFSERPILGLPAYSADQYTLVGKRAIAEFSKALQERHSRVFALMSDAAKVSKLVAMAIFHAEGSKLDRWPENEAIKNFRERIECRELQALGLPDPALHQQLYQILDAEAELLWSIRQTHMLAAFGKGREAK